MKRCCARLVGLALMFLFIWNVSPVHAEDKAVAESSDTAVGQHPRSPEREKNHQR